MRLDESQSYFLSIVRVLACFGSFIVHFGQRMHFSGQLKNLTDLGSLGVCVFFILSGFFGALKFDSNKNYSIKLYYCDRACRILPLYYFWIAVYFIIYYISDFKIPADNYHLGIIRYIFLLNDKIGASYFWYNIGATWTIHFFCTFYLILPFLSKCINNYKKSIILVLVVGVLFTIIYKITYPHLIFLRYSIFFFSGFLVYYSLKENYLNETGLSCLLINFISTRIGFLDNFSKYFSLFIPMLCTGLQIKLLNFKFFIKLKDVVKVLDKYSYTFYLTHCFFMILCDWLHLSNRFYVFMITVFGSIISTYIVFNFVEAPIKRFLKLKILK